jgi:phosphatidylserine/phosphatidylglycerophosphate/cardiolipin synthase-like enzyme
VYIFTEKRIREAIIKAKNRWLDVKVLLEINPYMAPNLNNKAFNWLREAWIDIARSNSKNYSLNHSKFMIVDNEVVVSTWNYSYSTFAYNRDFFLFINDDLFLKDIVDIFINDFIWNNVSFYNHNLVLSPNYSRLKLEKLISSAEKKLDIYFPYTKDDSLEQLLYKKAEEWIIVSMIVSTSVLKEEDDKKLFEKFEEKWIKIQAVKKPKIHSKSILVDSKYLYIWSINFSSYSIDKNREMWLIIKNKKVIDDFLEIFNTDFK